MDNIRNISRIIKLSDTSYLVKLELFDEWNSIWESIYYSVNYNDPAPINKYLTEQLKSGDLDSIMIPMTTKEKPEGNYRYDADTNDWVKIVK